jgi:hypothetical protein
MGVWRRWRMKVILRALNAEENMPDQERAEWTKVVADLETSDLSQREFAKERMLSLSNLRGRPQGASGQIAHSRSMEEGPCTPHFSRPYF